MSKRTSRDDYWLAIFEDYKTSKLSRKAYCDREDIPLSKFKYYLEKLIQKPKRAKDSDAPSFMPISITPSPSSKETTHSEPIEVAIELPNKIRCCFSVGNNSTQLSQLLKQLVLLC